MLPVGTFLTGCFLFIKLGGYLAPKGVGLVGGGALPNADPLTAGSLIVGGNSYYWSFWGILLGGGLF